jgi:hypothetical protein
MNILRVKITGGRTSNVNEEITMKMLGISRKQKSSGGAEMLDA